MDILITGGAGFIGSQLAKYLNYKYPEYNIVIYDIFNTGEKLENGNLKFLGSYNNLRGLDVQTVCGDVRDILPILDKYSFNFKMIFHLAAVSDTRAQNENEILSINTNPIVDIINLANKHNAKLVYASSAAVYGSVKRDKCIVGKECPENIYAYSKLSMDSFISKHPPKFGYVGLRYFNVFGPGEDFKGMTASVANQVLKKIKNKEKIILFNNSDKIFRDFIYIQDVIEATVEAALVSKSGIINIGTGEPESFQKLVDIILEFSNSKSEILYKENPYQTGYQSYTRACLDHTRKCINWSPRFTFRSAIEEYIQEYES